MVRALLKDLEDLRAHKIRAGLRALAAVGDGAWAGVANGAKRPRMG
jgi:hypothetical protein